MERGHQLGKIWALILGLWVLVGADLLRVAHFAHASHEYCAAHGVLEHRVEPDHQHPNSEPIPDDPKAPAEEHEACLCFEGIAPPAWVPSVPKPELWVTQAACRESTPLQPLLARHRIYRDAPKHSPPSA